MGDDEMVAEDDDWSGEVALVEGRARALKLYRCTCANKRCYGDIDTHERSKQACPSLQNASPAKTPMSCCVVYIPTTSNARSQPKTPSLAPNAADLYIYPVLSRCRSLAHLAAPPVPNPPGTLNIRIPLIALTPIRQSTRRSREPQPTPSLIPMPEPKTPLTRSRQVKVPLRTARFRWCPRDLRI